jgi:hypothetical protein
VYARVVNLRFPSEMRDEVVRVGRGLAPVLRERRGFEGLHLTNSEVGEGVSPLLGRRKRPRRRARSIPHTSGR